ncbi:MAG: carboxymuconolactone decarboxylase family protein [Opitutales bacterium]
MNEQTKELIAIGASIAAHCQPCLKYHYAKARELGVPVEEISAAIDVGHQIERGAGKAMRDFHTILLQDGSSAETSGCCGGDDAAGGSRCC